MVLYHHFTNGTSFIPYLNFASGNKDQVSIESDWDKRNIAKASFTLIIGLTENQVYT